MVRSIFTLPNELILAVIEEIEDIEALRRLARTCSKLQALTEPAIYRYVFQRTRRDAFALAASLVRRPERLQSIRRIESRQEFELEETGLDVIADVLSKASLVEEVIIESPWCNYRQKEARHGWSAKMKALLKPIVDFTLPRLTSVTLHLSLEDRRYWPIDRASFTLFTHPTLRDLKVSCATFDDDVASLLDGRPQSPLKNLALIECEITQKALRTMLAIPASLETLSLGENCVHRTGKLIGFLLGNRLAFMRSLQQQSGSLRSLAYAGLDVVPYGTEGPNPRDAEALGFDPRECDGLASFAHLTEISLYGCLYEFAPILRVRQTAPPALRRLVVHDPRVLDLFTSSLMESGREIFHEFIYVPPIKNVIPTLEVLDLVVTSLPRNPVGPVLACLKQAFATAKDMRVGLYRSSTLLKIPPFLYGEEPWVVEEKGRLEGGEVRWLQSSFNLPRLQPRCLAQS